MRGRQGVSSRYWSVYICHVGLVREGVGLDMVPDTIGYVRSEGEGFCGHLAGRI